MQIKVGDSMKIVNADKDQTIGNLYYSEHEGKNFQIVMNDDNKTALNDAKTSAMNVLTKKSDKPATPPNKLAAIKTSGLDKAVTIGLILPAAAEFAKQNDGFVAITNKTTDYPVYTLVGEQVRENNTNNSAMTGMNLKTIYVQKDAASKPTPIYQHKSGEALLTLPKEGNGISLKDEKLIKLINESEAKAKDKLGAIQNDSMEKVAALAEKFRATNGVEVAVSSNASIPTLAENNRKMSGPMG
jgi:hypothetical protein